MYRKAVLEPSNLILLNEIESFCHSILSLNKPKLKKLKNSKPKIGIFGTLSNSMMFNHEFLNNLPRKEFDIYLFNLKSNLSKSEKLDFLNLFEVKAFEYKKKIHRVFGDFFDFEYAANKINSLNLDLLFVSIEKNGKLTYNRLFDNIITDTIIIVANPGNYPFIHPKISIQSQVQLPPNWNLKNGVMRNTNGYEINKYKFIDHLFLYDDRNIKLLNKIKKDKKYIFIHGRLSKINTRDFLETIGHILINTKLDFKFMGFNDMNSLNQILYFFKKNNLIDRVFYLGDFSQKKDKNGNFIDIKSWERCKESLFGSSIFLNPFPKGSGSSRIEAFLAGIPVVDYITKNNKDPNSPIYVIKSSEKKLGTASNKIEYYKIALKILNDPVYSNLLINEQFEIAKKLTSREVFWSDLKKFIS